MRDIETKPGWYALRTKSWHEEIVRDRLAIQVSESFLPTVTQLRTWKD